MPTRILRNPRYRTPLLVPDILHLVFLYLVPSHHATTFSEAPWDLIASSMVCRSWYEEASPFLYNRIQLDLFRTLVYDNRFDVAEMKRYINLLVEFRHNGFDPPGLIEQVKIDVRCMSRSRVESMTESLETFFKLRPRNLTDLEIDITYLATARASPLDHLNNLFNRLQPIWPPIRRFSFNGGGSHPAHHTHIDTLLTILSPTLESLTLTNYAITHATQDALRRCSRIRDVNMIRIHDPENGLATVLPSWSNLREFCYMHGRSPCFDRTIHALAASCTLLNSFTLVNGGAVHYTAVTVGAVDSLLSSCTELKRLRLVRISWVHDGTLVETLLAHGRKLEHIDFIECQCLTRITNLNSYVHRGWPELRTLSLSGCHNLAETFVVWVICECPNLEQIEVPDHLALAVERWIKLNGFQYVRRNTWKRQREESVPKYVGSSGEDKPALSTTIGTPKRTRRRAGIRALKEFFTFLK
ncbi:hypothetical protein BC936DRAFT_139554 [Jimgerdemannia flammicorona]|uniref:F-box domain-containing protein n=1 Tax=Jimgerdemannia flammicorona TaxID=994334 RepID=A0A433DMN0_9FUNG|nr:hypothetical protein BC936DRAFT_139554 [Jimgerdemannia flammicorona]